MKNLEKKSTRLNKEYKANKTYFESMALNVNCYHSLRGTKDTDSFYIQKLCRACTTYLGAEYLRIGTKLTSIDFGKQDDRGGYSITLNYNYSCVYQYISTCKTQKEFIHLLEGIRFLGRGGF